MEIRYNVTGGERKRLADYIAGFLGCEKKYLGVPSCAYRVGYMEVSKDGTISFDDRADSEEIETLLEELEQEGFHAESALPQDGEEQPSREEFEAADTAPQVETVGLTVEVPLDKVAAGNFTKLLNAKRAKRVTVTEKAVDNKKYAFRCFPLRLGFISSEYKGERKILLKNLSGFLAFKNGCVSHAVSE